MAKKKSVEVSKPVGIIANCKPRHDRVLIRRELPNERVTPGGIHLPDAVTSVEDRQRVAIVVEVGEGYRKADGTFAPLGLKPGQTVLTARFQGLEINEPGQHSPNQEYSLIRDEDIIAIID